jgi:hypothetical protein
VTTTTHEPIFQMHRVAGEDLHIAVRRALPLATGGLLLGWWDRHGAVIVAGALEVPDPAATTTSWSCAPAVAQDLLDAALDGREPRLGCVGAWYGHAGAAVSDRDMANLARMSTDSPGPIVLLVHRGDELLDYLVAAGGEVVHGPWSRTTHDPRWTPDARTRAALPWPQLPPLRIPPPPPRPVTWHGVCPRCNAIAQWRSREGAATTITCPACDPAPA